MTITMTPEEFKKRWFFLRLWIHPSQRQEALTLIENNLHNVDDKHCLELEIPR